MKLKKIDIKGHKNLTSCTLNFVSTDGITVLVGNNGSGKSNVLEALSEIFDGLLNKKLRDIRFEFVLNYENNGKNISINNLSGEPKCQINNTAQTIDSFYSEDEHFPDKVFTVYSGEDLRLWNQFYYAYYKDFYKGVISNRLTLNALKLNYLSKYHWSFAILILAMKDLPLLQHIIPNQEIVNLQFDIDEENLKKFSASSKNEVTDFVNALKENLVNGQISLSEFSNLEYQLVPVTGSHTDLYNKLVVANLPKDPSLKIISDFTVNFKSILPIDDQIYTSEDLSEGQKKELLIALVSEILAGNDSLILLDEPDSHINPIRQKQLFEHLNKSDSKNIILTTHSPTLATLIDSKHVAFVDNGNIDQNTEKFEVLNNLTDGKWILDNISNLLVSNNDILLVEGKTDAEYITLALEKLKNIDNSKYSELKFTFLPVGGASGFKGIISKLTPYEGQRIIALLDRDNAGIDSYCQIFGKVRKNLTDNDYTEWNKKGNVDISFLPSNNSVDSNFEVEDYFGEIKLREIATDYINSRSQLKEFDRIKEIIKSKLQTLSLDYDTDDFEEFKILFDHILRLKAEQTIAS